LRLRGDAAPPARARWPASPLPRIGQSSSSFSRHRKSRVPPWSTSMPHASCSIRSMPFCHGLSCRSFFGATPDVIRQLRDTTAWSPRLVRASGYHPHRQSFMVEGGPAPISGVALAPDHREFKAKVLLAARATCRSYAVSIKIGQQGEQTPLRALLPDLPISGAVGRSVLAGVNPFGVAPYRDSLGALSIGGPGAARRGHISGQ